MNTTPDTTMFVEFYVTGVKYYTYFFCHVLHFAVERDEGRFVQLVRGNSIIFLNNTKVAGEPNHPFYNKLEGTETGLGLQIGFVVKDLEAAFERAKIFQTVKLTAIKVQPRGRRGFNVELPDGYFLRVTERAGKQNEHPTNAKHTPVSRQNTPAK